MSGNPDEPDETQSVWAGKSQEKLDLARDSKEKVRKALLDLEQKQADKIEAIAAERRRQERLAAEAAARAKREQEERARAEFKRLQAEELKRKQDAVKQGKRAEAQALKEATAGFKAAIRADELAVLRAHRLFEIQRSEAALQNAYIACHKQNKMWFVAVQKCEMRLEAREKRPPSELFVDNVQQALEDERKTLTEARAALKGLVDEGEKLTTEMAETTTLVITGQSRENTVGRWKKMETTRLDRSSSAPSLPAINNKKNTPATPTSPKDFARSMSSALCSSQEELLERAHDQITKAFELEDECMKVLENCRKHCNKAIAHSNASLDQRKADIDAIKKTLESEKLEAEGSIRDAAHRLTMLKMRASHHPQTPEEIEEIQAAEALVAELKDMKAALVEDWRNKSVAFKIDDFCRGLTATRAATMNKVHTNLSESADQLPGGDASFE